MRSKWWRKGQKVTDISLSFFISPRPVGFPPPRSRDQMESRRETVSTSHCPPSLTRFISTFPPWSKLLSSSTFSSSLWHSLPCEGHFPQTENWNRLNINHFFWLCRKDWALKRLLCDSIYTFFVFWRRGPWKLKSCESKEPYRFFSGFLFLKTSKRNRFFSLWSISDICTEPNHCHK